MERRSDDLLCLKRSNLPEMEEYLDRDAVHNITDFARLASRHKKFLWPNKRREREEEKKRDELDHYKAGDPIVTYDQSSGDFGWLTLPGGALCGSDPVRYMEDGSADCVIGMVNVADCSRDGRLDANTYLGRGITVLRSPEMRRQEAGETESAFVEAEINICEKGGDGEAATCVPIKDPKKEIPRPTLDCKNVLTELHLEIRHNSSQGVEKVSAWAFIGHVKEDVLVQRFKYAHAWKGSNWTLEDGNTNKRSGNPGYLRGLPLIVGRAGKDKGDDGVTLDSEALSIFPLMHGGNCFGNGNMQYGQNI